MIPTPRIKEFTDALANLIIERHKIVLCSDRKYYVYTQGWKKRYVVKLDDKNPCTCQDGRNGLDCVHTLGAFALELIL